MERLILDRGITSFYWRSVRVLLYTFFGGFDLRASVSCFMIITIIIRDAGFLWKEKVSLFCTKYYVKCHAVLEVDSVLIPAELREVFIVSDEMIAGPYLDFSTENVGLNQSEKLRVWLMRK